MIDLLDNIINKGLPKGNIMEFCAMSVQKYEKRMKNDRMKALQAWIKQRENAAKGIEDEPKKKKKKKKRKDSRDTSREGKKKKKRKD